MTRMLFGVLVWCLFAPAALAADVGVGININLGNVRVAPIVVDEPPLFLTLSPFAGLRVAVGIPYDMFFVEGRYYVFRDNIWHVGPGYNGPWKIIQHNHLPPGLIKHRHGDLIRERDREYERYRHDGDGYRGEKYRPEKRGKGHDDADDRGRGKGHGKGGKHKD